MLDRTIDFANYTVRVVRKSDGTAKIFRHKIAYEPASKAQTARLDDNGAAHFSPEEPK